MRDAGSSGSRTLLLRMPLSKFVVIALYRNPPGIVRNESSVVGGVGDVIHTGNPFITTTIHTRWSSPTMAHMVTRLVTPTSHQWCV